MVNIRKYNPKLLDKPGFLYCGRGRTVEDLGLGNPFSHKLGTAKFKVKTLQESINYYRRWLHKRLQAYWKQQTSKLEAWEKAYLKRVLQLTNDIESGLVTDLMCFCIELENYQPDGSKQYKCHTQILYEGVLEIQQKHSG